MTIQAVLNFMEKTAADQSLRQQLTALLGVGDGDISSARELDAEEAEALKGERAVLVADFARKQGYEFTVADLQTVVNSFERTQSGELSEGEFEKSLGVADGKSGTSGKLPAIGKTIGLVYRGTAYKKSPTAATSNSATQVLEFMEKTAEDEELRQALQAVLGVGDGDISKFSELDAEEAQALKTEQGALVAEFASEHGYHFSMADLNAVIDAFERIQAGEMTEEEFAKFLNVSRSRDGSFPRIQKVIQLTFKGSRYSNVIPATGQDNTLEVVRFMEKTANDSNLRQQLQAVIGGDGDISNPGQLDAEEATSLKGKRGADVVKFAADHGYNFTISDLSAVVGAFQLVQQGKLSEESCVRILGLSGSSHADHNNLSTVQQTATFVYRGVVYLK